MEVSILNEFESEEYEAEEEEDFKRLFEGLKAVKEDYEREPDYEPSAFHASE